MDLDDFERDREKEKGEKKKRKREEILERTGGGEERHGVTQVTSSVCDVVIDVGTWRILDGSWE